MDTQKLSSEQELAFDLGREIGIIEGRAAMEDLADRYYRAAYGDERRPQNRAIVTREELEARRRAAWEAAQPITVDDALRSWGIDPASRHVTPSTPATTSAPSTPSPAPSTAPSGTTPTNRSRTMSHISRTGNLAGTPDLRQGPKGPYTYAAVIVNDRFQDDNGTWVKGPPIRYELAVSGTQAVALVATAKACGNIRVTFSGAYTVREFQGDKGTILQHKVFVDEIGASFFGQDVTVARRTASTSTTPTAGEA
ncbi:single-stranded DNA-binding protein [Clavibacter michiganensis subsp. michiganensis]|uniref:single-stranded DNA-binding protein n=1 Tax=Clavibacter michiganensis TaxID=28447 RepID=UPI0023603E2E|nr:single-stranded DNA-binding protein [Clavibacter michiganensis]WDD25431.1 single-stranded DNA-binding protein [Clavibacter michiganensis subsp. michiganensis]WDD28543.1 single-stranded DNA-binding protein [Clavibacter michiganensis subsp. michiganensis]